MAGTSPASGGFLWTQLLVVGSLLVLLGYPGDGRAWDGGESPAGVGDDRPKRMVVATGQITDAKGTGVRGVAVAARPAGADSGSPPVATTNTDAVGDFTLESDEPASGEFVLTFSKARFTDLVHRVQVTPGTPPPFVAEVLRGDVTLRGRVTDARNDDAVVGASVVARAQEDERHSSTDSEGYFSTDGLSPGPGEISVEAKGFGREHRGIASLEDAGEVQIRLKPERVVRLKVVNDDGKPISGAVAEVVDQQRDDLRGTTTDGDGAAVLDGIHFDARALKARLTHPDHVSSEFFDRRIELPADSTTSEHELVMHRAACVTGRVFDAKTGGPVYGARVVAGNDDNDANPRDWSGVNGGFTIVGVRPGTVAVTVHRDDYAPELIVVDAKPGENATVEFRLLEGASLRGHVRDAAGKPVPDATVSAVRWRERGTLGLRAISDADGAFVLRNVPKDEFEVVVETPGRPEVRETINPSTSTELVITVAKQSNGVERSAGPAVGDTAPSVALATLDGKKLDPADMKGRVVVLDFWATWCAPCMEEMAYLAELKKKYAGRGDFALIAISRDMDEDAFKEYLRANPDKADWLHVFGDAGGVPAAAKAYGVTWIPRVIVIGHDGKVVATHARREEIGRQVEAAFAANEAGKTP